MKKLFKFMSLTSIIPCCLVASCGSSSDHIKGEILEIEAWNHDGVSRSGTFKCAECGEKYFDVIQPQDINMPIMNLEGNIGGLSGDDEKEIRIEFLSVEHDNDFNLDATIKIQGRTSKVLPKKNYNIQLYKTGTEEKQKIKFKNWPEMSKFTLKADWRDCRHVRNLGLAQIWSQIIHSQSKRGETDVLFDSVGGGATDGFPVLLYNNNSFLGLYEITIPKSKYLAGLQDDDGSGTTKHALLCAEERTETTKLNNLIDKNKNLEEQGWDLKHVSTEDASGWAIDSFNNMISFVNNSDDVTFKNNISKYIDLERTIDNMCMCDMFVCYDNVDKNINWCTYDGTTWAPLVWDLDTSLGYDWEGTRNYYPYNSTITFNQCNKLFIRISQIFNEQYQATFKNLRQSILKPSNIIFTLFNGFLLINPLSWKPEFEKWPGMPDQGDDFMYNLNTWVTKRWNWLESKN